MKKTKSKKIIATIIAATVALGLGILQIVTHDNERNKSEDDDTDTQGNLYYEDYIESDEVINGSVNA